jgi:hypothetical protein
MIEKRITKVKYKVTEAGERVEIHEVEKRGTEGAEHNIKIEHECAEAPRPELGASFRALVPHVRAILEEPGVDALIKSQAERLRAFRMGLVRRTHPGGIADALGHMPGRHSEHGSIHIGWLYVGGMSPAWVARTMGVAPELVLQAAAALGCRLLKVNGLGWRSPQGEEGPAWDPSKPWAKQASRDQLVVLDGRAPPRKRGERAGRRERQATERRAA